MEKKADGWHISWVENPKPDPKEVAGHVDAIHKAYPDAYPSEEAVRKLKAEQEAELPKCVARTKVREAEAKASRCQQTRFM